MRTGYIDWMKDLEEKLFDKDVYNLLHSSFDLTEKRYHEVIGEAIDDLMIKMKSSYFLVSHEILDWRAFLQSLMNPRGPDMEYIFNLLYDENKKQIEEWNPEKPVTKDIKAGFIKNLNRILDSKEFYDRDIFGEIVIGEDKQKLPEMWPDGFGREYIQKINRALFESVFPLLIVKIPAEMESGDYRKTNVRGYPRLKESLAKRYGVPAGSVFITNSASNGIYLICKALLKPGDHVIVERPCYEPLMAVPESLGANVDFLERKIICDNTKDNIFEEQREEPEFNIDKLVSLMKPATKLVILTNPYNPGSNFLDKDELLKIAAAVRKTNPLTRILIDEVYLEFLDKERISGSLFLRNSEIRKWNRLMYRLKKSEGTDLLISDFLGVKSKIILANQAPDQASVSWYDRESMVVGLNKIIDSRDFTKRCRDELSGELDEGLRKLIFCDIDELEMDQIHKINRLLLEHIYPSEIMKNQEIHTAFSLGDIFITVNSLSKVYGLSRLGCGWIFASGDIIKKLDKASIMVEGINSHLMESIASILIDRLDDYRVEAIKEIRKNRGILEIELKDLRMGKRRIIGDIPYNGCIYFPRVEGVGDTDHLAKILREEPFNVYIVPGHFFGAPGHIRIGFGYHGDEKREDLKEGLRRLVDGIRYYLEKFVENEPDMIL